MLKRIITKLESMRAKTSNQNYINWLRKHGVRIGDNCAFFGRHELHIDLTRPSLIELGNDVIITRGVLLLTHGYDWAVLREKYGEVLGSGKKITIKDNVFIGTFAKIMPGVTIGSNTIVAAGSIVTKSIEGDGVYAGVPAQKVSSLDEYLAKRKNAQLEEATEYAISIIEVYNRKPVPEDFHEFFQLFLERDESKFGGIAVKQQTGSAYRQFMNSTPMFSSFEEFLQHVEQEIEKSS